MKGLSLIHDIYRGENSLENATKRKLIASVSSTKVILDNKERLKVKINDGWSHVCLNKENLIEALRKIESETNLACFNNIDDIIDALRTMKDSDFDKLINIINVTVDSKDIIGYCKELRVTANVEGKMYNFTTPEKVLDIPIGILDPQINDTIIDSFNGESGVEIAIKEYLNLSDDEGYKLKYFGQEIIKESYEIGQLINFLITGDKEKIVLGDSMTNPAFVEGGKLVKYDISISAPPFRINLENETILNDPYNRFKYGVSRVSDWIGASHILKTTKYSGKAAILLTYGALFRGGAEERIRKSIINEDLIEAVIKLPSGIFPYSLVSTCWVIFNKDKEEKRKGKIQFFDLTDYVENIDRRNKTISQEGIDRVVKAYRDMEQNDISIFLDREQIEERNYRLNAIDYINNEKYMKSVRHIDMTELYKVAQIRRGVQVNKGKLDALNTGVERTHYLISIGNIVNGKIVLEESDKIQIDRKWEGVYEVKKGDLLVTSKGTLFKVALVDNDFKGIVSSNLFIIRAYEDKYIPEVLKYYLESELGQNLVKTIMNGIAIKSISHKDIEKLSVPIISMDIQKEAVKQIRNSNKEYEERIEKANAIYAKEQDCIKKALNLID